MILLTGATGKTGRAIIEAAQARGVAVRAVVHSLARMQDVLRLGAAEAVLVDLLDAESLRAACRGVEAIYHICPNVHPQEEEIGAKVIAAAQATGVARLFYHSVLHPHLQKMPHHWRKLRVEEMLLEAGIPGTIMQPTAYMQNLHANLHISGEAATFAVPYALDARICLVDLGDVAEVVAMMLAEESEVGGIYALVGTPPHSQREVAKAIGLAWGREVAAISTPLAEWQESAMLGGMDALRMDALLRMFAYYDQYGLAGSTRVLRALLGREPTTLDAYLNRAQADSPLPVRDHARHMET